MNQQWTSRKRVEAALKHQRPDRMPLDFAITLNAYVRLRTCLKLPAERDIQADRFYEVRPSLDLIEALGVDMTFVRLRRSKNWTPPPPLPDGTQLDEWGMGRRRVDLPGDSSLFEVTHSPWKDLDPHDIDLDSYPRPDSHAAGIVEGLEAEVEEETVRCIKAPGSNGGLILGPSHFIQPDVPPENIVSMCKTAHVYGSYPL